MIDKPKEKLYTNKHIQKKYFDSPDYKIIHRRTIHDNKQKSFQIANGNLYFMSRLYSMTFQNKKTLDKIKFEFVGSKGLYRKMNK